jgi:ribosomal protein L7/L12
MNNISFSGTVDELIKRLADLRGDTHVTATIVQIDVQIDEHAAFVATKILDAGHGDRGTKMNAIREVRSIINLGLIEAKAFVEMLPAYATWQNATDRNQV